MTDLVVSIAVSSDGRRADTKRTSLTLATSIASTKQYSWNEAYSFFKVV